MIIIGDVYVLVFFFIIFLCNSFLICCLIFLNCVGGMCWYGRLIDILFVSVILCFIVFVNFVFKFDFENML